MIWKRTNSRKINEDGKDMIVGKNTSLFPTFLKLFDQILVNITDTIFPFSTALNILIEIFFLNMGMESDRRRIIVVNI